MADEQKLVLPSPAPQSEAEGLKNRDLPTFEFAANPSNDPTSRRDSDTRHPINKSWTRARDQSGNPTLTGSRSGPTGGPPMKEKFD